MSVDRQFDAEQRRQAIALLEGQDWGDVLPAIADAEQTLGLILAATAPSLLLREYIEGQGGDEFSLSPPLTANFSDELRLAYAARLAVSYAVHYGHDPRFGGEGCCSRADGSSPAAVLHGLRDILEGPELSRGHFD
jgi:hypothetical protein